MEIKRIKLSILGISFSQVQAGAYALIFSEENSIRRLPIVIGTPEAQSIAIVMEGITPPRPLSHDLINSIFKELNINLLDASVDNVKADDIHAKQKKARQLFGILLFFLRLELSR